MVLGDNPFKRLDLNELKEKVCTDTLFVIILDILLVVIWSMFLLMYVYLFVCLSRCLGVNM